MSDTIKVMVPPVDWPLSKWEVTAEALKEFGWREVTLRLDQPPKAWTIEWSERGASQWRDFMKAVMGVTDGDDKGGDDE